jgi:bifunctional dethiobiotin synthetase / adenosylmethionine---8-amino-7-oxononanoate aminotransferase
LIFLSFFAHFFIFGTQAIPEDIEIQSNIRKTLSKWATDGLQHAFIETAGGVLSPGPNGTSQADLYRPLRLPIVLVADSRLGGISSSLSAFESLHVRGYDVHSVLLFEDPYYRNHEYLREYFQKRDIPLVSFPPPPDRSVSWITPDEKSRDREAMMSYYESMVHRDDISSLLEALNLREQARIDNMQSMADRTCETIWYPFTQHQGITAKDITVIDSAYGDYFQTYTKQNTGLSISSTDEQTNAQSNLLEPMFDGSASWWTQGLGHGNPDLSLAAAYAAGRYGHVMFAESIHEPALTLAELLIRSLQNPRLNKVFYSDNGSTGMEVAVKMALRAASARYGWNATAETEQGDIKVLGLKGSYHGDTIGVMDCSEPSTYNKKVEWYRGRGYWFDFPVVKMSKGAWRVEIPMTLQAQLGGDNLQFSSLNEVFNLGHRRNTTVSSKYQQFIKNTIEHLVNREGYRFGALIMEPVILGAGGMLFVYVPLSASDLLRQMA